MGILPGRGRRKHLIASRNLELAAGAAAFLVGALLLRDAYDGRGRDQPVWMRPFSFW
jgi:hypothetical protein